MASPELDINTGMSFTFAGGGAASLVARKITDVKLPQAEVEVFNSSHQGTTIGQTFIPADVPDMGTLEFTVQHKHDEDYFAEVGAEGEVVLTLPYTNSTLTFNAVYQSYSPQSTPFNEAMFADVVFKVSGDVTPNAGA